MLRGKGDYRIERWLAGGTPLVTVRSSSSQGPLPAVIVYHGFAGKKTDDLLGLAIPLADAGCMAVLPDAALHGERAPHDFTARRERDHDGLFLDCLKETIEESERVIRWVADRGEADPGRMGLVGVSMGAAVTLALACRELSHPLRAAVALMPAAPGPGSAARQKVAYAPDPTACFPTPLLMIQGAADHAAPYPNTRRFYDALVPTYSGAPERLRFIDVPGEEYRVGAYWIEETLAWLGRFL
jgi:dienelactone hydrolase